jgi:hypothetical protein
MRKGYRGDSAHHDCKGLAEPGEGVPIHPAAARGLSI